ncbi:hypothetical protein A4U53_016405 [Rhizobium ruizarguesonis]|uniref:DUF4352 domain-containing protein n=2 Tax=Rhizobium TaxID=379 RepID=A0A179BHT5_RHILE|nr:hypothetical protein [Rhizobium leguminosarum]OAP91307.1 hypothetical protein A4U53_27995 [Rhizobium leguminosarum]
MIGRGLVFGIILAAFSGVAKADEKPGNDAAFQCVAKSDFEETSSAVKEVRLANFTISEKVAAWNDQVAGVSISLAIQSQVSTDLYFAADFLLLDTAGEPVAALNVNPPEFKVEKGKGAIATGGTAIAPGALARTQRICMRWFVFQLPEGM